MTGFKVQDLCFSYNGHPVLNNINLNLMPGTTLGVLGVNGAGKSTLLKCLNRILKPQKGLVFLNSEELNKMNGREIAKRLGYVAQSQDQNNLTVFDAVMLGRKPHIKWQASKPDYELVENILNQMNLGHLAEKPLLKLSGGEAQKTMIARALAQEPKVLLLDEPTASLDMKNQLQVMNLIKQIVHQKQLMAVISLHDINLALRCTDELLMLKQGQVLGQKKTRNITAQEIGQVYDLNVILSNIKNYPVVIPEDSF